MVKLARKGAPICYWHANEWKALPDLESADPLGRFLLHADVLDHGVARPLARPLHQAVDVLGGSFEDRLHPAVRQVPHPAAHAVLPGHVLARAAVEHALHAPRNEHPVADHTATLRPSRVTPGAAR